MHDTTLMVVFMERGSFLIFREEMPCYVVQLLFTCVILNSQNNDTGHSHICISTMTYKPLFISSAFYLVKTYYEPIF